MGQTGRALALASHFGLDSSREQEQSLEVIRLHTKGSLREI